MPLGTTTWRKRNEDKLLRLLSVAKQYNITNPSIIHIGPGGAVGFMLKLLPPGQKSNWSITQKVKRCILKAMETTFRHTGLFELECAELLDLLYSLEELKPSKIYVFDKEDKVIRAATKLSNQHGIKIPVNGTILNIEKNGITNQGDIVVAYNVMNRAKDKVSCLKNIQSAVKQGGILSINHVINAKNFVKIEEGL
ncbi:MAG TPA: hypothetical protein DCQ93_03545 [Bacteroidetes bacterium]|nr:hypothetical protein [Bacteroidota bacterium]